MKKRILSQLAVLLSSMLVLAPSLSLAATTTARRGDAGVHLPLSSKILNPPPGTRRARPAPKFNGQTSTPLPDGRTILIGGEGPSGPQSSVFVSDPRTGETTLLPNGLYQARAWHTATMLPDGRILVLGGVGVDGAVLGGAEIYDPAAQRSEQRAARTLTARARHTATLLTDGRVLVVGGVTGGGRVLAKAELFDPEAGNAVTVPAQLSNARQSHSATLLGDGSVLFEGGTGEGDSQPLAAAELFNPEAGSFSFTNLSSGQRDANAPFLAASLPTGGATDVPVNSRVALRFSKPLRVESVGASSVRLTNAGEAVAAKIVPAENGRLVFITPEEPLRAATTYTVRLSGADDGALALAPYEFSFTTAEEKGADAEPAGGVDWQPGADNFGGNWQSKLGRSKWQDQPALQAEPGVTALSGQVLTLTGQPLADVTIGVAGNTVRTDATGRFLLPSPATGHHVMLIDGRTASNRGKVYGIFRAGVEITSGQTNVLPYTIWMPRLDMGHAAQIASPTQKEVVITNPSLPGLELRLPPGTLIRDLDGRPVTEISITPVPADRPPFPLPPGYNIPVFFTVQPGGARVIPPRARLIYPNYTGERPGARISFWNYDPEGNGWYVYGQGTVSADGKQVIPDPGVAVYEFNGIMISGGGNPPPNGPNTGGGPGNKGGDPVDLGTGLFVLEKTDLVVQDTMPITVRRTYRPGDNNTRAFGIGSSDLYGMFLWSVNNYQEADLILPDGGRVHYVRVSPGTGYTDAVYEHTSTPSAFYKSQLKWNGNGGWDLTLKDGTVYVFGDFAPLQSIRDRNGNKITITRTGGTTGNITQITSPNGRYVQYTYDGSNRVTQVKDNIGRTVGYTYDTGGRLWKVTDPNGGVTEYTYDSSNRMLSVKDARGIVYLTNEYDASGRVTKQTQADATTYQFAYTVDVSGKITQTDVTDPRGNVRRVTFNAGGYVLTDTYALGKSEQQTFTYERQAGSNLVLSATAPPLSQSVPGRKTAYAYDSMGNVTDVTRLAGTANASVTHYTFEPTFSQVASVTDPLSHSTSFAYDVRGNLTGITDALGHQLTLTYNSAGQPLTVKDALNNTTTFGYDRGDLSSVTDPLGRRMSAFTDAAGRVVSVTDGAGQSVRYDYDSMGQLVSVTDALGGVTSYTFDANGNLLSVTDARNKVTAFTYDNMDRLKTRTDPLQGASSVESYDYDAAGNLLKFTDRRGKVTTYAYDGLDRRTFIGFGTTAGPQYEATVALSHDAGNRLTQAVDSAAGTITRNYDDMDRLTSETTPQGTISYTYDGAGRPQTTTVSGQTAVTYSFDNANRLTQITQGTSTVAFAYDNANRRTSLTLPNGVSLNYDYDAASQVTGITYRQGTNVLGNLAYEYDGAGRRSKVGGSYARTGLPEGATASYDAANRLTQKGAATLTYDANGNLTGDGSYTYTWDARNQLVSVAGTGLAAGFQYDAFGRRIGKTVNGTATAYLYDGINVVQESQGGSPSASLLTGRIDEVFSRSDSSGTACLLIDSVGSTVGLSDASGVVQTQYTYDPFGRTTAAGAGSSNAAQYTGRENDGAGLYYYRARYYSPVLQRFISEDPIGFASGDTNLYAYTANNPINLIDPLGLDGNTPTQPSAPPTTYEIVRDWLLLLWGTGIPVQVGAGRTTTMPVPGGGEAIGTLQLGPELYRTMKIIDERNQAYEDALRCAQGDCNPREPSTPDRPNRPSTPYPPSTPYNPSDPNRDRRLGIPNVPHQPRKPSKPGKPGRKG